MKHYQDNKRKKLVNQLFIAPTLRSQRFSSKLLYTTLSVGKLTMYNELNENFFPEFLSNLTGVMRVKNSQKLLVLAKTLNKLTFNYRYFFFLRPLTLTGFFLPSPLFLQNNNTDRFLTFNFRRSRFFPDIKTRTSEIYLNLSLGLFASFFKKGKFFIKNKQVFLVMASFLRKILLFCSLGNMTFVVKRTPLYLQELLATLNNPVINLYKSPFSDTVIDESLTRTSFHFRFFIFSTSRPYGFVKTRKKGRVKRKITKRVTLINRLID